jgi:hypothetical protein
VSRELLMHAVAGGRMPAARCEVVAAYVVERWGLDTLERDAGVAPDAARQVGAA